jgi:hypothetical protein
VSRRGIELLLGVGGAVRELAGAIGDELEQRRIDALPIDAPFVASGVFVGAGTALTLSCGGPASGREWVLQRLIIGGPFYNSVVFGSAEVYGAPWVPNVQPPIWECVDHATDLPYMQRYVGRQIVLKYPQILTVIVQNGTAGATYVASGLALDQPEVDLEPPSRVEVEPS